MCGTPVTVPEPVPVGAGEWWTPEDTGVGVTEVPPVFVVAVVVVEFAASCVVVLARLSRDEYETG